MFNFNNIEEVEEDYNSFISSNIIGLNINSISDDDYIFEEKNNDFNFETANILKEIFEKNTIVQENDETNEKTNKINFKVNKDISLLNKKRNRNNDDNNLNNFEENGKQNNNFSIININIESDNKDISINKNEKHNIYWDDNIINKIKGYLFNHFIIDLVEKNLIKKDLQLKKLPNKTFIADLNKKKNEKLFKMKMADILCQEKISSKYSNFDKYENRKIIDKIYQEKKERNVIKILELTLEELLIIFRRKLNDPKDIKKLKEIKYKIIGLDLLDNNNRYKDIEYFIEEDIKKRYIEPDEYIKKFKSLCLGYQKWFYNKKGRAARKK